MTQLLVKKTQQDQAILLKIIMCISEMVESSFCLGVFVVRNYVKIT